MAAEYVGEINPFNVYQLTPVGYNNWSHIMLCGKCAAIRLKKNDSEYFVWTGTIPGSFTMATGLTLTFTVALADVPDFDADPGKVIRLGIAVKRLADGETTDVSAAGGTEQTKDITLDATAGKVDVSTLAIAAANLDSAAVGDRIALYIRRVASATQDTCRGSVGLLGVGIANT